MSIQIPDHTLFRVIGRGSYGEVWLAQNVMGSWRAVKIVRRDRFTSERPYEREFEGIKRFEPVSRTHDSQLDVLHVGRDEKAGFFFYVMELGDDLLRGREIDPETYEPRTLHSELLKNKRLPARMCVGVGIDLCTALTQLHEHGLIHRDIKPSNVIFVHGRPKLADIGLVAVADEEGASFVGTEGYVPPEGPGSARADLFSLGRMLYEISTGFGQEKFPEIPTRFGEDDDMPGRELNLIITKACSRVPRERHASAVELGEELRLVQGGGSVQHLREVERRLALLKVAGAAAVFVALFAMTGYVSALKANGRAELALVNARRAEADALRRSGQAGRRSEALAALSEAARIAPSMALRDEAIACLTLTDLGPPANLIQAPPGVIVRENPFHVAWSKDTTKIAWVKDDGSISLQHPGSHHDFLTISSISTIVSGIEWSPDGNFLAISGRRKTMIYSLALNQFILTAVTHPPPAGIGSTVSFNAESTRVGIPVNGEAVIYELPSGRELQRLRPVPEVGVFALHPTLPLAVFADRHDAVLWNLAEGREIQRRFTTTAISTMSWSPDGESIAVGLREGAIAVFNAKTDRVFARHAHTSTPVRLDWHPEGQMLATCSLDGHTQIWRINGGAAPLVEVFGSTIMGFNRAGTGLITVYPESVGVRPLIRPAPFYTTLRSETGEGAFDNLIFTPGADTLISMSNGHGLWLWDRLSSRGKAVPESRVQNRGWLGTTPQMLLATGVEGIQGWPLRREGERVSLAAPKVILAGEKVKNGGAADISPDNTQLLYSFQAQMAALLDLGSPNAEPRPFEVPMSIGALKWRPDGRQFAISGLGPNAATLLYDGATCQLVQRLSLGEASTTWSPDGRWLAQLTTTDCQLFEASTLRQVAVFPRKIPSRLNIMNSKFISTGVAFSGSLLAFITAPDQVLLVDLRTQSPVATLSLPDHAVARIVRMSPDGHTVLIHDPLQAHLFNLPLLRQALGEIALDWK